MGLYNAKDGGGGLDHHNDSNCDQILYIFQTSPVCYAELTLTDQFSLEIISIRTTDITFELTTIIFTSERLKTNRLYNGILNATNANGSSLSSVKISKFQ